MNLAGAPHPLVVAGLGSTPVVVASYLVRRALPRTHTSDTTARTSPLDCSDSAAAVSFFPPFFSSEPGAGLPIAPAVGTSAYENAPNWMV